MAMALVTKTTAFTLVGNMNERILELANEANKDIGYTFKMEQADQLHELMDKFAELIIKETMQVVANTISYNGYLNAAEAVIEHFGVRE